MTSTFIRSGFQIILIMYPYQNKMLNVHFIIGIVYELLLHIILNIYKLRMVELQIDILIFSSHTFMEQPVNVL